MGRAAVTKQLQSLWSKEETSEKVRDLCAMQVRPTLRPSSPLFFSPLSFLPFLFVFPIFFPKNRTKVLSRLSIKLCTKQCISNQSQLISGDAFIFPTFLSSFCFSLYAQLRSLESSHCTTGVSPYHGKHPWRPCFPISLSQQGHYLDVS